VATRSASARRRQVIVVGGVLGTVLVPFLGELLVPTQPFISQGAAFSWDPVLLLLHLLSDVSIGVAYVGISLTLIVFARRAGRRVPFLWAFVAFGVFIISCGLTHFMAAVTLWEPVYWMAGGVKYLTALSSVGTAIAVPPLVPKALALVEEARISADRQRALQRSHADLQEQATQLAQLATIVESAQDAIVSQTLDGTIISWNRGAVQLFGYAAAEMIGQPMARLIPRDQPDELPGLRHRIAGGEAIPPYETVRLCKDGTEVPVSVSLAPLPDAAGALIGMAAIMRDVSEAHRAEQLLRRAERMEVAGRIAGQVAHDFNNLLSPMTGYPDLIKLHLPPDHPALQFCEEMLTSANRMAEINTDLLTLGRRGHFSQEAVDLNQLVAEASQWRAARPPRLELEIALAPDLLPVRGSAAQLLRVVTNLIQNARDAMADQGRLTITTENVYLDQPLRRYEDIAAGEYVCLEVGDEGSGIDSAIADRIFDVFFTTKTTDRQRGSGLGLAVVQTVVTDHQGYVDFTSTVRKGTYFRVYLPVSRSAMVAAPTASLQSGQESILVVDDDAAQRTLLTAFLQTLGYQVATAESGEVALHVAESHPFALVILDMVMPPGMDGTDTFIRLQAEHPGLRAILLSGFAESPRVAEAQHHGAGAFLRKPVSLSQLSTAVREELDRKPVEAPPALPS
jgi:two-component system, cell cycle sensor histidine kinase and response regulator CckA